MTQSRKPRLSLILSFAACVLCLIAIPVVMIRLPSTATRYLSEHEPILMEDITFIIAMLYVGMAIAAAVLVLLICLLRVCRKGSVFTPVSGRLVLAIALLGLVYRPALAITVVAVTMGLCFTVVSQVLREAAALKEENDGTI